MNQSRFARRRRFEVLGVLGLSLALHLLGLALLGSAVIYESTVTPDNLFDTAALPEAPAPPRRELPLGSIERSPNFQPPRVEVRDISQVNVPDIHLPEAAMRGAVGVAVGGETLEFAGTEVQVAEAIEFFGTQATGRYVAYVVDFSGSMHEKDRHVVLRTELARSIKELPEQARVCVIMFAGPVWIAGDDPRDVREHWAFVKELEGRDNPGPELLKDGNLQESSWGWRLKKGEPGPRPAWLPASTLNKSRLLRAIEDTSLIFGTDWGPPFEAAFKLDPKPDLILFMTDGAPQMRYTGDEVTDFVISKARRGKPRTIINTVAFGEPRDKDMMEEIARRTRGEYRVIDPGDYGPDRR